MLSVAASGEAASGAGTALAGMKYASPNNMACIHRALPLCSQADMPMSKEHQQQLPAPACTHSSGYLSMRLMVQAMLHAG